VNRKHLKGFELALKSISKILDVELPDFEDVLPKNNRVNFLKALEDRVSTYRNSKHLRDSVSIMQLAYMLKIVKMIDDEDKMNKLIWSMAENGAVDVKA
jgi:energy-converting hydrogenase A subunit M